MKKHFLLAVFLLATATMVSGCWEKTNNRSTEDNDIVSDLNQNQEQNINKGQIPTNTQAKEAVDPSGQYSINELFAFNKPMKCSWKENATGDSDVANIIYLDNKKFYQDATMGDIGHSFMIYDGEYLYLWNDFNDAASKMKETNATTGNEPKKDSAGLDQKKDYICENWAADNSVFTPPQDKLFKDITEEMNQAVQEMGDGGLKDSKQMICDSCKKAPTPELRAQCLGEIICD